MGEWKYYNTSARPVHTLCVTGNLCNQFLQIDFEVGVRSVARAAREMTCNRKCASVRGLGNNSRRPIFRNVSCSLLSARRLRACSFRGEVRVGPFPDGIRELEANDPNGSLASLGTNLELPTNLVLPKYLTHCQATSLVLERKLKKRDGDVLKAPRCNSSCEQREQAKAA